MKPAHTRSWLVGFGASGLVFLFIQLLPVDRRNPPIESDVGAPPEVALLLREACYDCHSNETRWPSYARLAPVSWLVARDVRDAREELNFSRWNCLTPELRAQVLEECIEEVREGEMPPRAFSLLHRGARLAEADRALLVRWMSGALGGGELVAFDP